MCVYVWIHVHTHIIYIYIQQMYIDIDIDISFDIFFTNRLIYIYICLYTLYQNNIQYIGLYSIMLLYITDIRPFLTSKHPSHFTSSSQALDPTPTPASWDSNEAKASQVQQQPVYSVMAANRMIARIHNINHQKIWLAQVHKVVQKVLSFRSRQIMFFRNARWLLVQSCAMEGSSQVSPFNPGATDGVRFRLFRISHDVGIARITSP